MAVPPQRPAARPLNPWTVLGIPLLVATVLVLLELTDLDMFLARLAFDSQAGKFVGRHSYFLENVLHDRAKQAVIALAVLALIGWLGTLFIERFRPLRRELGCLVLSIALATSFVTPLKQLTQVQCPWSLKDFGGSETYSKLLQPRPPTVKPGLCWPGGHAATGFTLFAVFFVFRDRRPKTARAMFALAMGLGAVFSVGRMLQGAHFFSHNVWTAVFCWLICLGAYWAVLYRRPAAEGGIAGPAPTVVTARD
ncbi:phosphatase PAP2 family protein [Pseudomonas typographi]|uniref:phosphatase PAP2 family protein n=1 Tax=Pseudomonas typographi TaxID=2715964 RepID=UPI001688BDB8|nr:phosphatase PAP2 family protein [Pseudomonas typographi]MBD1552530.1 phosphatase PAP2 family protein [Pseudomonas typographi]